MLRLLHTAGPQPAVDVRAGALPLTATTELVASGLTMIGAEAGCRRPERVPAYLNNLHRLGLLWFSREAVPEQRALPGARGPARRRRGAARQGRGRTIRRSLP